MWKTMLKPKIIIGFQTTEATLFCRERCLGPLFCRGRCQVYKSEFEKLNPLYSFSSLQCVRAYITLNASEPNLLVLPVRVWQIGSIHLTTESFSWRTWRQHCIVYCYLSPLKTALKLKPTLTFSHCRKRSFTWKQVAEEESKGHALIQVSLHSMNFPSPLPAINDPTRHRK